MIVSGPSEVIGDDLSCAIAPRLQLIAPSGTPQLQMMLHKASSVKVVCRFSRQRLTTPRRNLCDVDCDVTLSARPRAGAFNIVV